MGFDRRISRREVLRLAALSAVGAIAAACQRAVAPATVTPVPTSAAATTAAAPTKDLNSKGAPPPAAAAGQTVPVTDNADFYTVWYESGDVPAIPADWKLTLTGQVNQELKLTLDQIKALPAVTEMRTLECISNPVGGDLISNAHWKGVRMKDLLAQAGVKAGARTLKLESFDGYSTSIPLDLAMDDHALLVYEMNGAPLPGEHGAPLRCLWPGRYGMKQPKWIQTITLIADDYAGYWEEQGWSYDAFILPNSRIDVPDDLAVVATPTFTLAGVAFSGAAGIAKVEVSWDEATTWHAAELARGPTPYTWTVWRWIGPALSAGKHQIYARVTDNDGKMQMKGDSSNLLGDTFPNGTNDMQSIVLNFRTA